MILNLPALGLFGALIPSTSGLNQFGFNPSSYAWKAWVRADDYVGSDGDAVTSVTPTKASGVTAFTGTATLKKAANGINQRNAFSFNGTTNVLTSSVGAASLTGDFYAAAVVRFASITGYRSCFTWGEGTNTKERSLLLITGTHALSFAFGGGELITGSTNNIGAIDTNYFIEVMCNNGVVTLWINGAQWGAGAPTLGAYTATEILLGNDRFNSFFSGLISEFFVVGNILTPDVQQGLRNYIQDRYGISMYAMGTHAPVLTELTGGAFTVKGGFAIQQTLAAHSVMGVHRLTNTLAFQGTLHIANFDATGFSGMTFGKPGTGLECAAITTTLFDDDGAALTEPDLQIEVSDVDDPTKLRGFRITRTVSGDQKTLFKFWPNGDLIAYMPDGSTVAWKVTLAGLMFPYQHATSGAPAYVKGGIYFDTTLNKLRVGGASAFETITSA